MLLQKRIDHILYLHYVSNLLHWLYIDDNANMYFLN